MAFLPSQPIRLDMHHYENRNVFVAGQGVYMHHLLTLDTALEHRF